MPAPSAHPPAPSALLSNRTQCPIIHGRLQAEYALTLREGEVLYWLSCGKANRDIADILGMSPRTVNKHLEHVYEKLGVEARGAAVALAVRTLRG